MSAQIITKNSDLLEKFPQYVKTDERTGYDGYVVSSDHLIDVTRTIRDELGYDYLSSITGVDYLPNGLMEVVYHFFKSSGGPALSIKSQVDRNNAVVPSLVSLYPGADFQEREDLGSFRDPICRTPRFTSSTFMGRV